MSLVTRSQVFPVPADALTVALVCGSVAMSDLDMGAVTLPATEGNRDRGNFRNNDEQILNMFVGIF